MLTKKDVSDLIEALQGINKELRRIGDRLGHEGEDNPYPLEAIAMQLGAKSPIAMSTPVPDVVERTGEELREMLEIIARNTR